MYYVCRASTLVFVNFYSVIKQVLTIQRWENQVGFFHESYD